MMKNALLRWMIGCILYVAGGDRLRIQLLRRVALGRRGRWMFDHYRCGRGQPVVFSTARLLAEDAGVCDSLLRWIKHQRTWGRTCGSVHVSQRDATDKDWHRALGSVVFNWELKGQHLEVAARGQYRWHPDQKRITQLVHRFADHLQHRGAQPFTFVGQRVKIDAQALKQIPPRRTLPVRAQLL